MEPPSDLNQVDFVHLPSRREAYKATSVAVAKYVGHCVYLSAWNASSVLWAVTCVVCKYLVYLLKDLSLFMVVPALRILSTYIEAAARMIESAAESPRHHATMPCETANNNNRSNNGSALAPSNHSCSGESQYKNAIDLSSHESDVSRMSESDTFESFVENSIVETNALGSSGGRFSFVEDAHTVKRKLGRQRINALREERRKNGLRDVPERDDEHSGIERNATRGLTRKPKAIKDRVVDDALALTKKRREVGRQRINALRGERRRNGLRR